MMRPGSVRLVFGGCLFVCLFALMLLHFLTGDYLQWSLCSSPCTAVREGYPEELWWVDLRQSLGSCVVNEQVI